MCAKKKTGDKKHILFSDEFYSDMSEKDMLYAVLVRSHASSGKILSIHFEPKIKLTENYGFLTAKDLGAKNKISILGNDTTILADEKISYKGEPFALLYGEDKEILEELSESFKLEIEESQNSPELIAEKTLTVGNSDIFFDNPEKSDFIVEDEWENTIEYKQNKETEGAFTQIKGGKLTVFTPSQWISQTFRILCEVTDFPKEKIFITQTKISSKTLVSLYQNGILAALASLVTIKTGKPVKLSLSRVEQETFLESTGRITIRHKTAIDKNALILAMDISIEYDFGAYNPFARYMLERFLLTSCGIYSCKNVKIHASALKTKKQPASHPLFAIDSYTFFAIENQIQKISEITGFSPIEIRQINKAGGLKKVTKPFTFAFGRATDAINAVAIRSDLKRKYTVARLAEHSRFEAMNNSSFSPPLKGIGLACGFEGSGYFGSDFEKANISLQVSVTEEKKILIHSIPQSPTIREIWIKLVQENIEIEKRNILFTSEFSEDSVKKNNVLAIPEKFPGDISIKTSLLRKCIESIKRKKIDGSPFSARKSISSARKKLWNQDNFEGSPFYNTAFGSCTVELELDPYTFREKLCKICVIIDGGMILNPKAAENTIQSAISHCLANLVDFAPLVCPSITVQFTQSEEEPKQIGNLIYSILPAAYTSALSQAVSCQIQHIPVQTDTVFNKLMSSESEKRLQIEDER